VINCSQTWLNFQVLCFLHGKIDFEIWLRLLRSVVKKEKEKKNKNFAFFNYSNKNGMLKELESESLRTRIDSSGIKQNQNRFKCYDANPYMLSLFPNLACSGCNFVMN